jgi:hypothetical protein
MSLLTTTAIVGPANVSLTEIVVANTTLGTLPLAAGNVFRITLDGTLGGPQNSLTVRLGSHGNTTDNVVYAYSTITSNAATLTALNNTANSNPQFNGLSTNQAIAAVNANLNPPTPSVPSYVAGELLLMITANATSNIGVVLMNPKAATPNTGELLSTLPSTLYTGNVSGLGQYLTVTVKAANANVLSFVGSNNSTNSVFGQTPGTPLANAWNLVPNPTPVSNGTFLLGVIEQLV